MYGCEICTIKKAERRRIDAFELWCWRRPLDCKEIQPVHPKGNCPEYSLEGLILKLKLQYFGHLMQRVNSLEKILMLGKIEGRRKRAAKNKMVGWHHRLNGHEFEQALGVGDGQGGLACCSP